MAFLQQPRLLERTNEIISKSGIVGEELNRLIMYLIFTSRKTTRPRHVISFGSSGTGKSHLQEKVFLTIPMVYWIKQGLNILKKTINKDYETKVNLYVFNYNFNSLLFSLYQVV